MTKFKFMWYGPLGCTSIAKHRTELTSGECRLVYFASYRAVPKGCKWAAQIVLTSKNSKLVCLCNDCRKIIFITICNAYPIARMDERIDPLCNTLIVLILDTNVVIFQVELNDIKRKDSFYLASWAVEVSKNVVLIFFFAWSFPRTMHVILSQLSGILALYAWPYYLVFTKCKPRLVTLLYHTVSLTPN